MKKWICPAIFAVLFILLSVFLIPSLSPIVEQASIAMESTLHIRLVCRSDETVRIYYDNGTSDHFDEDHVVSASLKGNKAEQTLTFSVPTEGLSYLRFQMGDGKNLVFNISEIELTSFSYRRVISDEEIETLFTANNNIGSLASHNGYSSVKTTGDFPYFSNEKALELTESRISVKLVAVGFAAALALCLALLVYLILQKRTVGELLAVCVALILIAFPLTVGFLTESESLPTTRTMFSYTEEKEDSVAQLLRHSPIGELYDTIRFRTMKISSDPSIVVGKDGYLFSDTELIDYKRSSNFPKSRLDAIEDALRDMDEWCLEHDKTFYFLIIPNKSTVYDGFVPSNIKQRNRKSRLEQLYENLYKYTDVRVIEVVDDLREKTDLPLYWRLDSAMTSLGGKTLANLVLKFIGKDYEDLPLVEQDLYTEEMRTTSLRAYAEQLGIADTKTETYYRLSDSVLTVKTSGSAVSVSEAVRAELTDYGLDYLLQTRNTVSNPDAQTSLHLYLMCDLAAAPMIPFLYDGFAETQLVQTHIFSQEDILASDADVVLFAIDEAKLLALMDYTED